MNDSSTTPKHFVFILMPFADEFEDIYKLGIKAACDEAGAYAERIDEQIFHSSILDRVYNQISKADTIIADMTGRNPNVFYECGYAHALGKRVILLTQHSDDIPFDLKHYPHIIYGGKISALKNDLVKQVKWCIDHPDQREPAQTDVELYSGQTKIDASVPNTIFPNFIDPKYVRIKLDFHNPARRELRTERFQFGLLSTSEFNYVDRVFEHVNNRETYEKQQVYANPDGGVIYFFDSLIELLPGAWSSIVLDCNFDASNAQFPLEFVGRIVSQNGIYDFPFIVARRDETN